VLFGFARVKEGFTPTRLEADFSAFAEWLAAVDLGSAADISLLPSQPVTAGADLEIITLTHCLQIKRECCCLVMWKIARCATINVFLLAKCWLYLRYAIAGSMSCVGRA
jgi:hypothetical protein